MSKIETIETLYNQLCDEISMAKDAETFGWEDQDFFTAVMLDYLEEAGEVEDCIICPFRGYGLQLNAYSWSDDFENVDIVVSVYNESSDIQTISKNDVDAAIKRGIQLYRKATNDLYKSFEKDSDTYEFAVNLSDHHKEIKKVRILALVNGNVRELALNNITIDGVDISFSIWDIDRLYRCITSGKMRETVEIDFVNDYGNSIPCIETKCSDKYSVYLAIISGELLAAIYEKHGPRLLERNVRSFLQVKGAVNKGIRDTLRNEPDMFLAYNNGISVTAESVEISRDENGKPSICKIRDMQIVNGGQTTASIFNAKTNKKINADLSNVYIQMKLSVIDNADAMDEIVPKISAYANTQNKIQMADFSANDPFHRKIEELSRVTWTPAVNGTKPKNWFYERARGQYTDMLSKETTVKKKKAFKEEHPLFTKTDLAKYENTWDQLPYQVSEGAQKNFKRFTVRLSERGEIRPDLKYYEHLIAKAILFRSAEKLIQEQGYGGYRANIVTYTLSYLSFATGQRINLDQIWAEQKLSQAIEASIIEISRSVQQIIVNPPGGANVSEWCKKSQCWDAVKAIGYELSDKLKGELIDLSAGHYHVSASAKARVVSSLDAPTEDEKEIIARATQIESKTWYALSKWAKETDNFQGWQRSIVFSVGQLIGRKKTPSYKQAVQALKVYDEAINKGFKN